VVTSSRHDSSLWLWVPGSRLRRAPGRHRCLRHHPLHWLPLPGWRKARPWRQPL